MGNTTRGVQQELKFALTKILATVQTDWSLNITVVTLVSETDCIRHLAQITSLTILGTFTQSLQLGCHGNFHALDGNRCHPHSCLVVRICRIHGCKSCKIIWTGFSSCLIYMQLVSNPKVNLSEPLTPVCLQPG